MDSKSAYYFSERSRKLKKELQVEMYGAANEDE
jgi:hypothetical protein